MCLIWADPPRAKTEGGVAYREEAEALRSNPGVWARMLEFGESCTAAKVAHGIRQGQYGAFKPVGSFEVKSRSEGGRYFVYAKYVGT